MLNEIFRSYKKIIILAMLMGSMVVFWFFGCHRNPAPSTSQVKWEKEMYENGGYEYHFQTGKLKGSVVFGLKGYTVKDKNIPVTVHLTSGNEEFSGIVRISIPGNSSGGVAYQSGIHSGEYQNASVSFVVPQLGNASYFCFEICDQYENIILSEMEIPSYSEWNHSNPEMDRQICLGVLSQDIEKLEFLDEMMIPVEEENILLRTIVFDSQSFPQELEYLDMISGIYVDDFDINTLSKKQQNVLFSWVKKGGHLILATGRLGDKDLRGFGKEFGVHFGDVETGRLYFGENSGFSGETGVYLNQLSFEEDAGWRMVNWSEPASFYERSYGEGQVHVLRFSLTDEALLQWNRLTDMSKSLMKHLLKSIHKNSLDQENSLLNMEMALFGFNQSQLPNSFYYGIFFLTYLLTLTFLAYFYLSRQKKREYIWILVPVIAIFFTGCILVRFKGTSGAYHYKQDSLSAIRVLDNRDEKNEIYLMYQNAEGESKQLNFIPTIDMVKPLDYEYGQETVDYSRLRKIDEDYTINHGIKGYNVFFGDATPGTIRMLEMTENKMMNYAQKDNMFAVKVQGEHTTFSGKIMNISDQTFDKVLVIRGNQYWMGDSMKPGDDILLSRDDVQCSSEWDDESEELFLNEDNIVLQNIFSYLAYRYGKNNSDLGNYIVMGISLEDHFPMLENGERLGNQVSIYVNHFDFPRPENAECQTNINLTSMKENKTYKELSYELEENDEVEVNYQFDSNKIVWAMARNRDSYRGKISAYNYQKKCMEEILSTPDDVMYCEALEPYLSEMNEMRILYELPEEETDRSLPVLSVWLKKTIRK